MSRVIRRCRALMIVLAAAIGLGQTVALASQPESDQRPTEREPGATPSLRVALEAVRAETGFEPPSVATADRAEAAFHALLSGDGSPEVLARVGLVRRRVQLEDGEALAVADPADDVRGRGFYLIQDEGAVDAPVLLQAPHRFKDLDTGAIVAQLAATGAFRMSAWNTVPRWAPDDRSDRRADLAHRDISHFNAATAAFAAVHPSGVVVQVHGFATGKRRTAAGSSADVIVSSGTTALVGPARRVRACLRSRLSVVVRGYGDDVSELGATTNRNAAMLRARGFNAFVHVELDRPLRRSLRRDADQRGRLRACLLEAAE